MIVLLALGSSVAFVSNPNLACRHMDCTVSGVHCECSSTCFHIISDVRTCQANPPTVGTYRRGVLQSDLKPPLTVTCDGTQTQHCQSVLMVQVWRQALQSEHAGLLS